MKCNPGPDRVSQCHKIKTWIKEGAGGTCSPASVPVVDYLDILTAGVSGQHQLYGAWPGLVGGGGDGGAAVWLCDEKLMKCHSKGWLRSHQVPLAGNTWGNSQNCLLRRTEADSLEPGADSPWWCRSLLRHLNIKELG